MFFFKSSLFYLMQLDSAGHEEVSLLYRCYLIGHCCVVVDCVVSFVCATILLELVLLEVEFEFEFECV